MASTLDINYRPNVHPSLLYPPSYPLSARSKVTQEYMKWERWFLSPGHSSYNSDANYTLQTEPTHYTKEDYPFPNSLAPAEILPTLIEAGAFTGPRWGRISRAALFNSPARRTDLNGISSKPQTKSYSSWAYHTKGYRRQNSQPTRATQKITIPATHPIQSLQLCQSNNISSSSALTPKTKDN